MADETGRIKSEGLGFFTNKGVLKTREQLKTEDKKTESSKDAAKVSSSFSDQLGDALGKAEARFVDKSNRAIAQVQTATKDLRDARDLVSRQITAAKELKQAIKNGTDDDVAKRQAELADLQAERERLAERIDQNNRNGAGERTQVLSLSTPEKGKTVRVKDVEFSKETNSSKPTELSDKQSVDRYIESLQADREALKAQTKELKATKTEIKEAVQGAKDQLSAIREDSIKSYDEARAVTDNVAQAIKNGGISVVEQTINKSLSSDIVSELL